MPNCSVSGLPSDRATRRWIRVATATRIKLDESDENQTDGDADLDEPN